MAANRDDAQIVSIKTDIQTMMQTVPAMSFSQAEANTNLIANTVATNPALWTRYSGSFGIDGFNFSTALFANFYSSATPSRKDISTSCVIAWVHKKQAVRGQTDASITELAEYDKGESILVFHFRIQSDHCKLLSNDMWKFVPINGKSVKF
ncbi:MAG: hypothetical protein ACTTJS_02375 [Wolinella sp.]